MTRVLLVHVCASCVVSLPRDEAEGGGEEEGVAPQVLSPLPPPTNLLLFWGDVPIFDLFVCRVTLGVHWRGLEGRNL